MTKIKITTAFIFVLFIILILISQEIRRENTINNELIDTINKQKEFAQEISKNIFYIYKNKNTSTQQLDYSIEEFLKNIDKREERLSHISSAEIREQSQQIILLWNKFYLLVQKFINQSKTITPYTSLILEKTEQDIYHTNILLIIKFNKLIETHRLYYEDIIKTKVILQYIVLFLLLSLLIYLFTQVKLAVTFIQKFLYISKNIIQNSTIKELQPIKISSQENEITQAAQNFNLLIKNINQSIEYASSSIKKSYQSLDLVEKNIEDLMELIFIMEEKKEIDIDLTKKEDALIQSLEELSSSARNLKNLKINLENLISHFNQKKIKY